MLAECLRGAAPGALVLECACGVLAKALPGALILDSHLFLYCGSQSIGVECRANLIAPAPE